MKIAFAGERGAFAELAAAQYFGPRHALAPVPEFEDVFSAVEQGKVQQGIIPIENSLTGSIHQNYDLLLESDLAITGEIFLRVFSDNHSSVFCSVHQCHLDLRIGTDHVISRQHCAGPV